MRHVTFRSLLRRHHANAASERKVHAGAAWTSISSCATRRKHSCARSAGCSGGSGQRCGQGGHRERTTRLGLNRIPTATYDPPVVLPSGGCSTALALRHSRIWWHGIGLDVHDPASTTGATERSCWRRVNRRARLYISPTISTCCPTKPKNRAFRAKIRPAVEKYKWIGVRSRTIRHHRSESGESVSRCSTGSMRSRR